MVFELIVKYPDLADQLPKQDKGWGQEVPEEVQEMFDKYVKWGEYVTLRFNTETKTVEVLTA